jgi:carboxylesterase 2
LFIFAVPLLFGTFNTTGATAAEAQLSKTFQTMVANFVKNPTRSPAPNFLKYNPSLNNTLAELAFNGNVEMGNVVQAVSPSQFDEACLALWDQILLSL